ncbi:hypothetical protein CTI14_64425 [Methylobacterium radiotolerans]|nr:hypothetical protein CTI14_64425 [Methylobacterium radiotolerans]
MRFEWMKSLLFTCVMRLGIGRGIPERVDGSGVGTAAKIWSMISSLRMPSASASNVQRLAVRVDEELALHLRDEAGHRARDP